MVNYRQIKIFAGTTKRSYLNQSNNFVFLKIVKLRQGSGKDRQGMALKAKGLKAPLPRAYIKVGCHPPPPKSLNTLD